MLDIRNLSATEQAIWVAKLSIWTSPVEFCWDALMKKFWYKNGRYQIYLHFGFAAWRERGRTYFNKFSCPNFLESNILNMVESLAILRIQITKEELFDKKISRSKISHIFWLHFNAMLLRPWFLKWVTRQLSR